jgi:hypothetical protein
MNARHPATPEFLKAYVEAHGFKAWIVEGKVAFAIPCTQWGKPVDDLIETVSTYREAREALGY